jgi:hypothetical protein
MADYALLMLYKGYLVSIPIKGVQELERTAEELKELGFKQPRFAETFSPVNGEVVRMEMHDKKTKTGKDMFRFFVKEDGNNTEHVIIAFEKNAFKRGERVTVSMGQYGKQAASLEDAGWDSDDDPDDDTPRNLDLPF